MNDDNKINNTVKKSKIIFWNTIGCIGLLMFLGGGLLLAYRCLKFEAFLITSGLLLILIAAISCPKDNSNMEDRPY